MILFRPGNQLKALIITGIIISFMPLNAFDILSFFTDQKPPAAEFLLTEQEFWIKRKEEIDKQFEKFKEEFRKRSRELANRKEKVSAAILELEAQEPNEPRSRSVKKKLELLNDRRVKIDTLNDIFVTLEELYRKESILASEMIEVSKEKRPTPEPVLYTTLNDVRNKEEEIAKALQGQRNEKRNIERLDKQKKVELERRIELEKEIGSRKEWLNDSNQSGRNVSYLFEGEETQLTKSERDEILNIDFVLLNEQKELIDANVRKIDIQIQYSQDRLLHYERLLKTLKKELQYIESRLRVTKADVDLAKEELETERKMADEAIKKINEHIVAKKKQKEALRARNETLESQRRLYAELMQGDQLKEKLLLARIEATNEQINELTRDIDLEEDLKRIESEKIAKEIWDFRYVELRYKLPLGEIDADQVESIISEYRKEQRKQQDELELLEEAQKELSHLGVDIQRRKEAIEKELATIQEQKTGTFKHRAKDLKEIETALEAGLKAVMMQGSINPRHISANLDLYRLKKEIITQLDLIVKTLETQRRFDIWQRSPRAIKWEGFLKAMGDGERLLRAYFSRLPYIFNISVIWQNIFGLDRYDLLGILVFIIIFFLMFIVMRYLIIVIEHGSSWIIEHAHNSLLQRCSAIVQVLARVILAHYNAWFIWFFFQINIIFSPVNFFHPLHTFAYRFETIYIATVVVTFYLCSAALLLFLARIFLKALIVRNHELHYVIWSEEWESTYYILWSMVLYGTAFLLPLREAFLAFGGDKESFFPSLLMAMYTLLLTYVVIAIIFTYQAKVLRLIKSDNDILGWMKWQLQLHGQKIFIFFALLITLSNPYVGYSNLAYKLLFVVPLSVFVLYLLFFVHYYLRKYSAYWFITEEEGEVVGRFEYAKTYYGIFIILTFLLLLLASMIFIGWIWGYSATIERLYVLFSDEWTIPLGPQKRLGVIQFITMVLFVAGGFVTASLLDRFVMSKIFDVLRMDPGIRNTISSILNYVIIYVIVVLGLNYIQFGDFVFWVSGIFALGIGVGAQPFLGDLIAGFLVLIERPVEIGNFIETGGIRGTVQKIAARATTIRTYHNHLVVIPNKELITQPIINWGYGRSTVGFDMRVPVSYETNPELIREILVKVVQSDPRILRIPATVFRLDEFIDVGMVFLVRPFISARRVREQWDIAGDLRFKIYQAFKENNISIPYPHRIIYFANGSPHRHKTETTVSDDISHEE